MTVPHPKRKKPTRPYPSLPLTPHNNGHWCKKVRRRVRFFGAWDNPDAALQNYLRHVPDLHAGREAGPATLSADGVTVKQVVNPVVNTLLSTGAGRNTAVLGWMRRAHGLTGQPQFSAVNQRMPYACSHRDRIS